MGQTFFALKSTIKYNHLKHQKTNCKCQKMFRYPIEDCNDPAKGLTLRPNNAFPPSFVFLGDVLGQVSQRKRHVVVNHNHAAVLLHPFFGVGLPFPAEAL